MSNPEESVNVTALNKFVAQQPVILMTDDIADEARSFYTCHFTAWPHAGEVNLLWCNDAAGAIKAINGQPINVRDSDRGLVCTSYRPQLAMVIADMVFDRQGRIGQYPYHGEAIARAAHQRGIICLTITNQPDRGIDTCVADLRQANIVSDKILHKGIDEASKRLNLEALTMYYQRTQYPIRKLLADLFKAATTPAVDSSLDLKHGSQNLAAQLDLYYSTSQSCSPEVTNSLKTISTLSRSFINNYQSATLSDNLSEFVKQLCNHAKAIGDSIGGVLALTYGATVQLEQVEPLMNGANKFAALIDSIRLNHAAASWCRAHGVVVPTPRGIDEALYLNYPVYMIDSVLDVLHHNSQQRGFAERIQVEIEHCPMDPGAPLKLIFSDNGIGIRSRNYLFAPNSTCDVARGLPWVGEHIQSLGGDIVVRTKVNGEKGWECGLREPVWKESTSSIIQLPSGTRIELIFYPYAT